MMQSLWTSEEIVSCQSRWPHGARRLDENDPMPADIENPRWRRKEAG